MLHKFAETTKKMWSQEFTVKLNLLPHPEKAQAYEHFSISGDSQKCCAGCFKKIERYVTKRSPEKKTSH